MYFLHNECTYVFCTVAIFCDVNMLYNAYLYNIGDKI